MTVRIEAGSTETAMPMLLFSNIFDTGTVTISSDTEANAGENTFEESTFDAWLATTADANISVDMGSAVWCDTVGVDAHALGTEDATLLVQSSTDGSAWTTRLTSTPADDSAIIGIFPLTKARYWRVRVTGGPAAIGVIRLGRRVIIPTGVLSGHIGVKHSKRYEVMGGQTIGGHFLSSRVNRIGAQVSINFGLMDTEFVDTELSEFETHFNEGKPFFYAGNPLNFPEDIGFCRRAQSAGELKTSYEENGLMMPVAIDVEVYINA